jgi:hypothetical protein
MNGKTISLWSKILAIIFVVPAFFFSGKETVDVIQIGIFIFLVTSPIDVSIWLDKFTGGRR